MKTSKVLFLVFLIILSLCAANTQPVKSQSSGTIHIRSDGSVDPSTAPIQRVGNVYVFSGDIFDSIIVERDNVVIDGAGYLLQGTGNGTGIALTDRSNVTIKNVQMRAFSYGIYLDCSSNNIITKNMITNITYGGIYLSTEPSENNMNNIISGNTIRNNGFFGIRLWQASNNTISGNTITLNGACGIAMGDKCTKNSITGNYITHNKLGVGLDTFNTVTGNYIANNEEGIYFSGTQPFAGASNNLIYHNSFVNNTKQVNDYHWTEAFSSPSINVWDNGYPSGGNYWSDYEDRYSNATELGAGIWNTPYIIDENNQDNYPLINPVTIPEPPDEGKTPTPPTISIISPENKTYTTSNVPLTFSLSEPASWIGYSLDGQANVTINGNTTLSGLSDGSHSLTVYARGPAGKIVTSETIYFSIETFPTTWIVAATAIIAIGGVAFLVYFRKIKKTTGKAE